MANIKLPRDAEGREIPLDTKVLYDDNGQAYAVETYCYAVHEDMPDSKWGALLFSKKSVELKSIRTTALYLTTPDSWEKLEEDLGRAAERDVVPTGCRYFNATNKCAGCPLYDSVNCDVHRDERAFGNIISRIRKLRGEGE